MQQFTQRHKPIGNITYSRFAMAIPAAIRSRDLPVPANTKKPRLTSDVASRPSAVADPSKSKPTTAPRAAPAFLSALNDEENDFPRGGGSSLTPFELRQIQVEGRREADAEVAAEVSWLR